MYKLNCKGMKPTYYTNKETAENAYIYLFRYFSGVSLIKITANRYKKDYITGRC